MPVYAHSYAGRPSAPIPTGEGGGKP
jgi:hypothetical protein